MSFLFPKLAAPQGHVPAPPRYTDAEVGDLAAEQRRKLAGDAAGRRGTMGGGLLGVVRDYQTSTAKVLGLA